MHSNRPGVLLVLRSVVQRHDGAILLIRRSCTDRHGSALWECPGGKLDGGEDLPTAQAREVWEETGLYVQDIQATVFPVSRVIDDGIDSYDGFTYVVLFSVSRVVEGSLSLTPDEHDEAAWVTYNEALCYPLTPETKRALVGLASVLA